MSVGAYNGDSRDRGGREGIIETIDNNWPIKPTVKDGGTREIVNFVKSNRIENIDVNLIWTSLLIINVIPLPPSTPNILIGQLYYRRSPAKNTAVRGLQVHGCLNRTQPNSRKLRREGGGRQTGWHWAPDICHQAPTCGLLSPLSPVAFLPFLSPGGELGAE